MKVRLSNPNLHQQYREAVPATLRALVDEHLAWSSPELREHVSTRLLPFFDSDADGNLVCTDPVGARAVSPVIVGAVAAANFAPAPASMNAQAKAERAAAMLAAQGLSSESLASSGYLPPSFSDAQWAEHVAKLKAATDAENAKREARFLSRDQRAGIRKDGDK